MDDSAADPLAAVAMLPGVFEGLEAARGAVDALLRDLRGPALRRRVGEVSAAALRRSAWASASLELGDASALDPAGFQPPFGDDAPGRTAAGAWRVSAALSSSVDTWERAPAQVLARLHALAAADVVPADRLGRPDPSAAGAAERMAALAQLLSTPTGAPALVVAAVTHGELLTAAPFGSMDGVVARAAARLVTTSRGLDATGAAVVEEGHLELGVDSYVSAAAAYASGTAAGVAAWVVHCAQAVVLGARAGRLLAAGSAGGSGADEGEL